MGERRAHAYDQQNPVAYVNASLGTEAEPQVSARSGFPTWILAWQREVHTANKDRICSAAMANYAKPANPLSPTGFPRASVSARLRRIAIRAKHRDTGMHGLQLALTRSDNNVNFGG